MKSFKQFILEAETYRPVNANQSIPLYGPGSSLPPGLEIVPVNAPTSRPKPKPRPGDGVSDLMGSLVNALLRKK